MGTEPNYSEWQIQKMEAELAKKLNSWRVELKVKGPETFQDDLKIRPFVNPDIAPSPPDLASAEYSCRQEAAAAVQRENPTASSKGLAWLVGSVVAVVTLPVLSVFGPILGIASGLLVWKISRTRWQTRLAALAAERARTEWVVARARVQGAHAAALSDFGLQEKASSDAWLALERRRIARLERLLRIETAAIDEAVTSVVVAMARRFDAECVVTLDDEDHVLIDVNLPEFDETVPETQYKVLKNGTTRETKRKAFDRNQAYSELICGIALAMGAGAFSAAPTLMHVTVAGKTQRQKRASVELEDTYVFEVKLPRDLFAHLDATTVDPVGLIRDLPSRIEALANGSLKRIVAPGWTANFIVGNAPKRAW